MEGWGAVNLDPTTSYLAPPALCTVSLVAFLPTSWIFNLYFYCQHLFLHISTVNTYFSNFYYLNS
jgi:hypothetical protein